MILAHAGHWILYIAPVVVVLAAVIAGALRERSRSRESAAGQGGTSDPSED